MSFANKVVIITGASCMRLAGSFASKRTEMPSSGCTLTMSRLGAIDDELTFLKMCSGGRRNWMAISVVRFGRRLPVRT